MSRQQVQFPVQQLHIATPTPPPAGSLKLYPKADNVLYKLTSAGVESAVGVIPDPLTIGGLTVNTSTVLNGTVSGTGVGTGVNQIAAGNHTHNYDASYVNVTGDSMSAKLMISQATGGIASTGASEGQIELQNAGSGASKITFHRVGAYALYLGLDTDNVVRIGGWSMGGVAYRIVMGDSYANPGTINGSFTGTLNSMTHSGHLTMSGGYIFGSYINLTADVAGGKPTYVAGNNGDNYIRWWPIAAIGPPSSAIHLGGSVVQTWYDNNPRLMMQLTVNRTGYWGAVFFINTSNPEALDTSMSSYISIRYNGTQVATGQFGSLSGGFSGGGGAYSPPTLISNGQVIQVYLSKDYGDRFDVMSPGYPQRMNLVAYFQPTAAYNA